MICTAGERSTFSSHFGPFAGGMPDPGDASLWVSVRKKPGNLLWCNALDKTQAPIALSALSSLCGVTETAVRCVFPVKIRSLHDTRVLIYLLGAPLDWVMPPLDFPPVGRPYG